MIKTYIKGPNENVEIIYGKKFEVSPRYVNLKFIGRGSYGIVASALDTVKMKHVAIKKISPTQHRVFCQRTLREIQILKRLRHRNIISILQIFKSTSDEEFSIYLVQELMEIDLSNLLKLQKINHEHIRYFLYQILCGLKYIHSANVIHRDLKPANLIVNSSCDLKICDFGLSRVASPDIDYTGSLTEYVATRWYRAPEIMLNSRTYSKSIDIWSVGCIFAEMLANKPLFPGRDYLDQLNLIFKVIGTPTLDKLSYIRNKMAKNFVVNLSSYPRISFEKYFGLKDKDGIEMLSNLLTFNPDDRITVEAALALPYLSVYHDEELEPIAESPFIFDIDPEKLQLDELKQLLNEEAVNFLEC